MTPKTKTFALLFSAGAVAAAAIFLTRLGPDTSAGATTVLVTDNQEPVSSEPEISEDNKIQIAILLDTSGSMNGLIDQARSEMWSLVNEFSATTRSGKLPTVSLSLYEYGKPSLGSENGYVRQVTPLTADLDRVSEALFSLETDGGEEYSGFAISHAVENLEWDDDPDSLKIIFIAGNESFNQGPVDYREAMAAARKQGIIVNTIYCGSADDPDARGWSTGAQLAHGRALNIDHNAVIVHVPAPQDDELARLGAELNGTYVPYGRAGGSGLSRQLAMDKKAASKPRIAIARAKAKASKMYSNKGWDLVDAVDSGADLEELAEEELPQEMRSMELDERKQYVSARKSKRAKLRQRIAKLSKEREKHVAQQKREGSANTLDAALFDAVREQAGKKGYQVKK